MTKEELDDLLYTLDLCAETLPFDLLAAHAERLRNIRAILETQQRRSAARPPARVLALAPGFRTRNPERPQ